MRLLACLSVALLLGSVSRTAETLNLYPATDSSAAAEARGSETRALEEMLGDPHRQVQRWLRAPELKVLVSVMEYRGDSQTRHVATAEQLTETEIAELVGDLTDGLGVLTANAFEQFPVVTREILGAGETASIARTNQIVVGRFRGLRQSTKTLGFGGRRARSDGSITAGAIMLDDEFDRTSGRRRLLRTHELGHALGYNHVRSTTSIMNPGIGVEPNAFDRQAALIAFRSPALLVSR